jgi:hypothetical protein
MVRCVVRGLAALVPVLLLALGLVVTDAAPAHAICGMGGPPIPPPPPDNYGRPGGGVTPGLRPPTDPPTTPTTPTTPDSGGETPTTPSAPGAKPATPNVPGSTPFTPAAPATGGTRRPRPASGDDSEASWRMWWYFNRWQFLPVRNDLLRAHYARTRPLTGENVDALGSWDRRRAELVESHARPSLIAILRKDLSSGNLGIKTPATLALARLANDELAVEAVMQLAEDKGMLEEVRRAAAFSAGLFRRTDPKQQMDGVRLDLLRKRLFALMDDEDTPIAVRGLSALSLGMLADQPEGTALPSGLVVSHGLWQRLMGGDQGVEMTVALLTALGFQPRAGVPDAVLEGLRDVVMGRRLGSRPWNAAEESHALCGLVRIGAPAWRPILARMFGDRKIETAVRRAAFITLGRKAAEYDAAERKELVKAWEQGMRQARDPLTQGLALIALGRILAADVVAGDGRLLQTSDASRILLREAKVASTSTRGFAVLGLALAARATSDKDEDQLAFRKAAQAVVAEGLERSQAGNLGPYAVAAGLLGDASTRPALERIVADGNEDVEVRGFAAVACGQIAEAVPSTVEALRRAVLDRRMGPMRSEAALGLAFLTGPRDAALLRAEIEERRHVHGSLAAQIAVALGQMGDLDSVEALSNLLLDDTATHGVRGAAAIGLGLLCDPEERPSLRNLSGDVNYPARTVALQLALSYF